VGRSIYLDHNATAPLLPEAWAAMQAARETAWANPSSVHGPGRQARAVVEAARADVAALLGAEREEIVFTSGGTEADHLGIRGLAWTEAARRGLAPGSGARPRVVASRIEHPAVTGAVRALEDEGFEVAWIRADDAGRVAPAGVEALLDGRTVLVTLALANHELGTEQDLAAVAEAAHARGALVHTDAVQAVGRVSVDVRALGADAVALSAHKLGGPKGTGALWLRPGLAARPLIAGGHQEHERRAGTENVLGIAGFGAACRVVARGLAEWAAHLAKLQDRLEAGLLAVPGSRRNGPERGRAPGTSNVAFGGAPGQLVMIGLDLEGICVSTGAACTSGSIEPSSVLLALGQTPEAAREAVRFSLGPSSTLEDVDEVLRVVPEVVRRVRAAV
jgi:cysteine desulfurase